MKTLQIKVIGKVQGVGFRYYTHKKAQNYNIKGFVKNEIDGSVYIEAEGEEADLDKFVSWVDKGPMWARVQKVVKSEMPKRGFIDFKIK
jgi:acylphosphatase